jgi:hypothetical protein
MATVKISELPALTGANTAATDVIPIVDVSGNITNKITREEFFKNIQSNVGIGTTSPQTNLEISSASSSIIRLTNTTNSTAGAAVYDFGALEFFTGDTSTPGTRVTAKIAAEADTASAAPGGELVFYSAATASSATERMRIDSSGNVGIGTTSPQVPLDVAGAAEFGGVIYRNQPAQTSKAAAATLTIAELLTGIIQYTGGAATLTLPTGTLIEGGTPASFPTNMSFDFSVINTGSGTATLGTATGLTLVGAMTVTAGASGMFRVRKTATNTYTVYRIA